MRRTHCIQGTNCNRLLLSNDHLFLLLSFHFEVLLICGAPQKSSVLFHNHCISNASAPRSSTTSTYMSERTLTASSASALRVWHSTECRADAEGTDVSAAAAARRFRDSRPKRA